MLKKLIIPILFILLPLFAQPAVGNRFQLSLQPEKRAVIPGEKLNVKCRYFLNDEYYPVYLFNYVLRNDAPEEFGKNLKWSGPKEKQIYSFKGSRKFTEAEQQPEQTEVTFEFDTGELTRGDYRIGVGMAVRKREYIGTATPGKDQFTARGNFYLSVLEDIRPNWQNARWYSNFKVFGSDKLAEQQTRYQVATTPRQLHFRVECDEPQMQQLKTNGKVPWDNDCVEVNLMPPGAKNDYFYKIVVGANGTVNTYKLSDDNVIGNMIISDWDCPVSVKSSSQHGKWVFELTVPMASMEFNTFDNNESWKYLIARGRRLNLPQSEYSSDMEVTNTLKVADYGVLHEAKALDMTEFNWTLQENAAVVTGQDYSPQLMIQNQTGKLRCCIVRASLRRQAKTISENAVYQAFDNSVPQLVSPKIPVMTSGEYELILEITDMGGIPYYRQVRSINIDLKPFTAKLLPPVYMNNLYASMNIDEINLEINMLDPQLSQMTVEVAGKTYEAKTALKIKTGDLTYGEYPIKIYPAGKPENSLVIPFRKLAPLKGECYFDENGIAYVDGVSFLPYGWDAFIQRNHISYEYPDNFNQTVSFAPFVLNSIAEVRKFLDQVESRGLKTIIRPYVHANDEAKKLMSNRRGLLLTEQKTMITSLVNAVKDHPALLGWYISDEPEMRSESPEWTRQVCELLNDIDPYHPGILSNCQLNAVEKYRSGTNVGGHDVYCHFYRNSLKTRYPLESIAHFVGYASRFHPVWMFIQAFSCNRMDHPECRPPDETEFRNQVYQVFAANGKGVLLYSYPFSQMFYPMRLTPDFVGKEIKLIKDLLLAPNRNEELKSKKSDIIYGLKKHNGHTALVAVNPKPHAIKTGFAIAGTSELYVMSEQRSIAAANGWFEDEFQPYETHVYLAEANAEIRALSFPDLKRKVAELEKTRIKPGNLVGIGAKTSVEIMEMRKNGIPAGMPVITASSERLSYYFRNHGTLFYLLDGMIEDCPMRNDQGWAPLDNDKSAWIKITLPKPAKIREVLLYTPEKRLQEATLKINGNSLNACNQNGVLAFKVDKQNTAELTIEIKKTGGEKYFPLLTEIEVYGEYHEK